MKRILIIEDDPAILKGLAIGLREEHYDALQASNGDDGYQMAKKENLDLIILDLMLPGKNGREICQDLRKDGIGTPILILSVKKGEIDKVTLLEIGADDYMTKPFSMRELLARIRALLRRKGEITMDIEEYSFGAVHVDFKKMEATKVGRTLKLTAREFKLLKFLIQHEREAVSRDMLLDEVWGYESYPDTRTVDNFILSLRKKIETDPAYPKHLLTIPTVGYKFVK